MSGAIGAIIGAAVAIGTTVYSSNKQEKSQKKAMAQAQQNAEKQAIAADQAMNKENQKRPNTSEILDAASQAGRAGVSGTMLTGASGIGHDQLALGRKTLLGA